MTVMRYFCNVPHNTGSRNIRRNILQNGFTASLRSCTGVKALNVEYNSKGNQGKLKQSSFYL